MEVAAILTSVLLAQAALSPQESEVRAIFTELTALGHTGDFAFAAAHTDSADLLFYREGMLPLRVKAAPFPGLPEVAFQGHCGHTLRKRVHSLRSRTPTSSSCHLAMASMKMGVPGTKCHGITRFLRGTGRGNERNRTR